MNGSHFPQAKCSFLKKYFTNNIIKACFSSQVLQMALWSCINQLNAGMPEKEVSLPLVHLAYHRFRNRLQNFSRILTIHPPILLSLTKGTENHNWARHEMVWPLLGIFHACSLASSSECGGRGAPTPTLGRGSLWALFQLGDIFTSTHVSVASQLEYI